MAASDPTPSVATPTGALQGVAAFSWDGTTWQPSAGSGPDVATATGVLRGVAPFSWDGANWQPAGRAQPGAPAVGGVLDGVAVYTWSGSAWTPANGNPSTPSGALRGVAAFNWDGTAWQPAGRAGPTVATPYGVLDGVAMFNWTGSGGWAAGPSLDIVFSGPTLDPRVTFARASTATYFNSAGVMQTAATNAPRFDYNPSTLAWRGLLIEEARTNLFLHSGDLSVTANWNETNVTVTGNQGAVPDGTSAAAQVVYVAVPGSANYTMVAQGITVTANPYAFSVYLRGAVGGEQLYLMATPDGVTYYRTPVTLTTAWQRFTLVTPALTAALWYFQIGTDLRDGSQTAKPAQTIFAWGAQLEQGAFATSYIPTVAVTVARSADVATIASIPGRNTAAESFQAEVLLMTTQETNSRIIGSATTQAAPLYVTPALNAAANDTVASVVTANAFTLGNVAKMASTWATPNAAQACLNAGAVASAATLTAGFAAVTSFKFMGDSVATDQSNGYIRRFRYWPRTLAAGELQAVTT